MQFVTHRLSHKVTSLKRRLAREEFGLAQEDSASLDVFKKQENQKILIMFANSLERKSKREREK